MKKTGWRLWELRPKDGRVLAWHGNRVETVWIQGTGWEWCDGERSAKDPSHWMPHPKDPTP